jgi:hypothetical protein
MSLLYKAVSEKSFDTRVLDRNLERNLVAAKDFEKMIKDLPDDSINAEYQSIESLIED